MLFFNKLQPHLRHFLSLVALVALLSLLALPFSPTLHPVQAASVDALQKQKALLEQQAQQAQRQAEQKKSVAQQAEDKIAELGGQISDLQKGIEQTQATITTTQQQIEEKNQEVANLESEMGRVARQQDAVLREMYIQSVTYSPELLAFSTTSLSDRESEQAQFSQLQRSAMQLIDKTKAAKLVVEKSRADLVASNNQLQNLVEQQGQQRVGMASMQQDQQALRDNAVEAVKRLQAQATQARAQENKIEQQISAELAAIIAARTKSSGGTGALGGQGNGQHVSRGTLIGHEGNSGNSTGPHVHFECRSGNVPVNCQPYVNAGTLAYPIQNFSVTQKFGETANSALYNGAAHTGMDLAGPYGTAVHAPADGTVILNKWYGGYGNAWAEQLDNGLVVLLGHMTGS